VRLRFRARHGGHLGAWIPCIWKEKRTSLQAEFKQMAKQYPETEQYYRKLFKIYCDIEEVASFTPAKIGESAHWAAIVSTAENRDSCCKALTGKILFSVLYGTYTVTLNDLKSLVKARSSETFKTLPAKPAQEEDFKEVRRRKRQNTTESAPISKKPSAAAGNTTKNEVSTRNFFAPLRVTSMDTEAAGAETIMLEEGATKLEEETSGKAGRAPQ
jgi:hypothetical protein